MTGEWFLVCLTGTWLSLYKLPQNTINSAFLFRVTHVSVCLLPRPLPDRGSRWCRHHKDHATTLLPAPHMEVETPCYRPPPHTPDESGVTCPLPSATLELLEPFDNVPAFSAYKINMKITNDTEEIYDNCQGNMSCLNG